MADGKQPLTLARWNVATGQAESTPDKFSVLLNPAEYSRNEAFVFDATSRRRLSEKTPQTLTLNDLVFDGTGAVSPPNGAVPQSVDAQLDALRAVVAEKVIGKTVRMPIVELLWGSLYFVGRLTSLDVKYTLFKPSGEPLRARVSLKFMEYERDYSEHKTRAMARAAAATRIREAVAGSTLPLMCFDAYQDPRLDQVVARENGLTSIRNLVPGTALALLGLD